MSTRCDPPVCGRGRHGTGKGADRDVKPIHGCDNTTATLLVFPAFKGHYRRCAKCRRPYQLLPMSCTVRDGRQTHCPSCFWDVAVNVHGEYARGER